MNRNLKTIVSMACALALLGLIGCHARKCATEPEEKTVAKPAAAESRGWKDSWPKRPPLPGSTAEPEPPTEQFTMDRHFVFMFRDQDLAIEQMERRKEIEIKYQGAGGDEDLIQKKNSEIRALQLDIGKKRKALFAEFGNPSREP